MSFEKKFWKSFKDILKEMDSFVSNNQNVCIIISYNQNTNNFSVLKSISAARDSSGNMCGKALSEKGSKKALVTKRTFKRHLLLTVK